MKRRARESHAPAESLAARSRARPLSPFADRGAFLVAGTVLAARIVEALWTRFVFDDALITARYGRNLARGLGLAFNAGEPSYGFTSPVWVAISAVGHLLRVAPHPWLAGWAIACDTLCAYLAARLVPSLWGRVVLTALLVSWSVIVLACIGGMETSLLGLCALAWWARVRPAEAAALAPLVRPEGWLLPLAHVLRERHPKVLVSWIPGALWTAAAWMMFGSPFPLSAEAKRIVYGGARWELATLWLYHLGQLPVWQVRPIKTALVVSSASLWITALAFSRGGRGWGLGLALGWFVFLVAAGAPVFEWYLALPSLLLIVSACRSEVLAGWRVGAAVLALCAAFLLVWTVQDGAVQRRLLDRTWGDAARFAARVPGARSAFAEAVGVLGWEFPGIVWDEIGIVTPRMASFRQSSDGWYYRAVMGLEPDLLLVRPYYLYKNQPVAGEAKPFVDESQFQDLGRRYVEVADFADTIPYASPGVSLVRVLVRRELAPTP